jgi:hypothetical protein
MPTLTEMEGLWALIGVIIGGFGTFLIESLFSKRNKASLLDSSYRRSDR